MSSWREFSIGDGPLSSLGKQSIRKRAYLATRRADGSPRINPVCPVVTSEHLVIGVRTSSRKFSDLVRDGRCALHGELGPNDAEFQLTATAWRTDGAGDEELLGVIAASPTTSAFFILDIHSAAGALYQPDDAGLAVPDRRKWVAPDCAAHVSTTDSSNTVAVRLDASTIAEVTGASHVLRFLEQSSLAIGRDAREAASSPGIQIFDAQIADISATQLKPGATPIFRHHDTWLIGHPQSYKHFHAIRTRLLSAATSRPWLRHLKKTTALPIMSKQHPDSIRALFEVALEASKEESASRTVVSYTPTTGRREVHQVLPLPGDRSPDDSASVPTQHESSLVDKLFGPIVAVKLVRQHKSVPRSLKVVHAQTGPMRDTMGWANDPIAAGTSFDDSELAVRAAIGEAVERYCGNIPSDALLSRGTYHELLADGKMPVDPETLVLFSQQQHDAPGFPFVPMSRELHIHWVAARNYTAGHPSHFPASLAYANWRMGRYEAEPCTNNAFFPGLAAGTSREQAARSGLLEVVERHATMVWWANRQPMPRLRPYGRVASLEQELQSEFRAWALVLENEFAVPVVGAVLEHRRDKILTVGFAARSNHHDAALKAYAEALTLQDGARDLDDPEGGYWSATRRGELRGDLVKPWRADRRYTESYRADYKDMPDLMGQLQYYLDPAAGEAIQSIIEPSGEVVEEECKKVQDASFGGIVRRLGATGYNVHVADLTTSDVAETPLRVVRVLVPGTVPNYSAAFPFLGLGKVADAAVTMGWRDRPLSDNELNYAPLPHA